MPVTYTHPDVVRRLIATGGGGGWGANRYTNVRYVDVFRAGKDLRQLSITMRVRMPDDTVAFTRVHAHAGRLALRFVTTTDDLRFKARFSPVRTDVCPFWTSQIRMEQYVRCDRLPTVRAYRLGLDARDLQNGIEIRPVNVARVRREMKTGFFDL